MKFKKIVIWSGVVIIILIPIYLKISGGDSDNAARAGRQNNKPITVNGIILAQKPFINKIKTNGTILSNESIELRSETAGKIVSINFNEGSRVGRGSLLVKINDSELQAQLKKAEANRQLAAQQEYRQNVLLEKNGTSIENYDKALNELKSIEADIEFIKSQIEKTEIRSPFAGLVGLRSVSQGSYISPATKIADFHSINPVKIDFYVPQKYYSLVESGRFINFSLPSSGKIYKAKIYAIEPGISENTGTLHIRATCPNEKGELMPGAFVEVEIELGYPEETVMIPTEALVPSLKGEKVYLYKSGKSIEQVVKTGTRTEEKVQILSGLQAGDTLIVSGIILLKPNLPVKIKISEQ